MPHCVSMLPRCLGLLAGSLLGCKWGAEFPWQAFGSHNAVKVVPLILWVTEWGTAGISVTFHMPLAVWGLWRGPTRF